MFPVIWYFLFGSWFGQSGGRILANGYQGGRLSLSSLVGRLGHGSSSPSADDLSGFTSPVLVPAMSPSPSNASMPPDALFGGMVRGCSKELMSRV